MSFETSNLANPNPKREEDSFSVSAEDWESSRSLFSDYQSSTSVTTDNFKRDSVIESNEDGSELLVFNPVDTPGWGASENPPQNDRKELDFAPPKSPIKSSDSAERDGESKEGSDQSDSQTEKMTEAVKEQVKQLGSDDFEEREAASRALEKLGVEALPALEKERQNATDFEVKERLRGAIEVITKTEFGYKLGKESAFSGTAHQTALSTKESLAESLEKYAHDPEAREKRVEELSKIMDLANEGKVDLDNQHKDALQKELDLLKDPEKIKTALADTYLDIAGLHSQDSDSPEKTAKIKSALSKAHELNPSIAERGKFVDLVVSTELTKDSDFMNKFEKDLFKKRERDLKEFHDLLQQFDIVPAAGLNKPTGMLKPVGEQMDINPNTP